MIKHKAYAMYLITVSFLHRNIWGINSAFYGVLFFFVSKDVELPGWGMNHAFGVVHDPIAPVLQNKTALLCSYFYFFRKGLKQTLPLLQKKAPPSEGLFCSVRGVAGSRTRVQTRRPYAFYMLSYA